MINYLSFRRESSCEKAVILEQPGCLVVVVLCFKIFSLILWNELLNEPEEGVYFMTKHV